jgi:hypothetical protein
MTGEHMKTEAHSSDRDFTDKKRLDWLEKQALHPDGIVLHDGNKVVVQRFRKKPVVIEAMQYTAESCRRICEWAGLEHGAYNESCGVFPLIIPTLEGPHNANPGDWIIKGVKGEFYPCKPDIFEATYEPA